MDKIIRVTRISSAWRWGVVAVAALVVLAGTAIATSSSESPDGTTATPMESVQIDLSALEHVDFSAVEAVGAGSVGGAAGGGGGGAAGGGGADVLVAQY